MNDLTASRAPMVPRTDRNVFVLPLVIRPEHIDENGHVNNVVYVGWLQEAGTSHWNSLFDASFREEWSWIALRHEIDYLRPIAPNATGIVARTWIDELHGPCAIRCVRIEDKDGHACAQGKTTWCLVDAVKLRPRRITAEMIDRFQH
jgi:acyl-CoA thioester hydrolase